MIPVHVIFLEHFREAAVNAGVEHLGCSAEVFTAHIDLRDCLQTRSLLDRLPYFAALVVDLIRN